MPRAPRRFPAGPAIVSSLLLLAAAVYLIWRTPEKVSMGPAREGFVRILSWNLADDGLAGWTAEAVAAALLKSNADAVCLQGLSSDADATSIADRLGRDWRVQAIPGPSGWHLAVMAGPRLEVAAYHLVPTSAGDAVALTVRRPGRQSFHVICVGAAPETSPAGTTERYLAGVLAWCDAHPAALTVLATIVDTNTVTGTDSRQRIDERFALVAVADAPASRIRVAPSAAPVTQAGVLTIDDGAGGSATAAVADVPAP